MKENKKKVLVLGFFGFIDNQLDGQTIKTRNVYSLLKSKEGDFIKNVSFFDTQTFQKSKLNVFRLFKLIIKTDVLFYLPAHGNLKFIFPFIFVISKLFNTKIHYIVVGGWLAKFLKNKPIHVWMLSRIERIYPENRLAVYDLQSTYNFKNVQQLNNFRCYELPDFNIPKSELIRLVFMARVHPQKGVRIIFKIEEELNRRNIKNVEIDIFGPIYSGYKDEFKDLITNSKIVRYKGVLEPRTIYENLVNYNLMLFPTNFFTEGFPGSILDAYISRLPVIASSWKYASEFVEHNKTGIIVEFGNDQEFVSQTIKLIESPTLLNKLKIGATTEADKYSAEEAWNTLYSNLI